jgi:hypothetical protein
MRSLLLLSLTALTGCATFRPADRESAAEARGYERGYRQAVKEQYWIIQNQQRAAPPHATSQPAVPPLPRVP